MESMLDQPSSFADLEWTALFCTLLTLVKIIMKDDLDVFSR